MNVENCHNSTAKCWLIYAMGGGWGHLVRALALGRIAGTCRPVLILCNSPYAADILLYAAGEEPQPIVEGCYLEAIPHTASFDETRDRVREVIFQNPHDLLIVDTFPRGLGGELADLLPQMKSTPRVFVHRDLDPNYVRAKDLSRFVAENFELILIPGTLEDPPLAHLPQVRRTAPWSIRTASELPDRATARQFLRLNPQDDTPAIVVLAAGRDEELQVYGELTVALAQAFPQAMVRCLSAERPPQCPPSLWVFHWPGIECLPAADVVVGGGGYNSVYECVAVGVPLVAFAFARQYDRQGRRLLRANAAVRWVEDIPGAIAAVAQFLRDPGTREPRSSAFVNGAVEAVNLIVEAIADGESNATGNQ
ncbi:glycosyltransferase [Phormidium sp. CCY1219]|uniref:glycosyltransferase n=1 Tax=Phormidium sp. CCY1219 TaxID=2886104 RepID=UPI002D1F3D53|nr:hypothetical protein [Phormidium sp. CCY1219]MEB3830686.1 hypothetical protein [Phormidium sp. CCY1219]